MALQHACPTRIAIESLPDDHARCAYLDLVVVVLDDEPPLINKMEEIASIVGVGSGLRRPFGREGIII